MKHYPLGTNLLKSEKKENHIIGGKPEITDKFLDKIEKEDKEGKIPPEGDFLIHHYTDNYHHTESQYTINRKGEVKSLKGEVMKYIFYPKKRGPRIRIQITKRNKQGNFIVTEKEINVLQLMEKKFGKYIVGYKQKKDNPQDYILAPKDGNYNNLKYENLQYITKKEYYETKAKKIETVILAGINHTSDQLCKMFDTTQQYISKIKHNLAKSGKLTDFQRYQQLQKELGIEFNEESQKIYQILIECKGKLSNSDIAKILWPKELLKTKNKRILSDKIVRARKRLTDKGFIPRFNKEFESKREEAIKMIKDKKNSKRTNKEIADRLGLKKQQIDNLARQIKKDIQNN